MVRPYTVEQPFRFWCQKILPLVYDDSLSYYELLNKVVDYLNKNVDNVNALGDAFNSLQKYVQDYFSDLNVQQEINAKLDAMVQDGTLNTLVQPLVGDAVSEWLEDNVTPTGSAVLVDSTLTISGAAADAKVTGDELSDLKSDISKLMTSIDVTSQFIDGGYIAIKRMVGQTVDTSSPVSSSTRSYAVVPCSKGDIFVLTGKGGDAPRLYGFLDTDKVCLSVSSSEITVTDLSLTASEDGYFVCNILTSAPHSLVHRYLTLEDTYAKKNIVETLLDEVDEKIDEKSYKYGFAHNLNDESLWEQGTISTSNGNNSASQTRIRTKTFLNELIEKAVVLTGYMNVYIYSSDGTFESVSGWGKEYTFNTGKKYRLIYSTVAGSSGASEVNPSTDWDKFILLSDELYSHKFRKKIAWAGSVPCKWYSGKGSDYSLFTRETMYSDYISSFNNLVANSDYVSQTAIGTASDGQTLYKYELIPTMYRSVTITDYNRPPKVIIISGQHGFEKSSCYGLYYFVRDLLNNYADSEVLAWIRSSLHLIIIPVVNPYGFNNLTRKNANDVDLNRNWNPGWESGSSSDSDYGGASAFDQPETQAVKSVIDSNKDALYFIDFHTNGMGRAEAWNKVNWNTFNVDVYEDDYYLNALKAINTHITQLTECMSNEYQLDTNGEPLGSVETNNRGATAATYAKSVDVMANTFEGTNGFPSESSPYSANIQKANSEMIGNWVKILVATFRALN